MKELGAYLKEVRRSHGVSLEEASDDLNLSEIELENMESGNTKAFKDIYHLRHLLQEYAKYLGLDKEDVTEEFNDFLFEHTSKISLQDILDAKRMKEEEEQKKVISPYTIEHKKKRNIAPVIFVITIFFLVLLIIVVVIKEMNKEPIRTSELKGSVVREYTY